MNGGGAFQKCGKKRQWSRVPGRVTTAKASRTHPKKTEKDSGGHQGALPIKYLLFI